jgi:regulator of replication initiation timing
MTDTIDDERTILYQKIDDLEKKIVEERNEHKEIYYKMRKNMIDLYAQNCDKGNITFQLFHLQEENKRLREENEYLKSKLY